MPALRPVRVSLVLSAAAITLVALAGCSLGNLVPHSATKSSSPSASPKATATDSASGSGCPAGVEEGLKQVTDSGTDVSIGTVEDLTFPGDTSLFADACILVTKTSAGNSAIAIVPGDAAVAAQIEAPIEAAGYTPLTKSDETAFYSKGKESWIVSTATSSTPLPSGVGSAFSGPHLTVAHTVVP